MGRGESSREQAKNAILLFAADQKKHKQSEFIKELVDKKGEFAKNTVYKYLGELATDKLMRMEPGSPEDRFKPDYSITKNGLEAVERYKTHESIDSLDARWLVPMRNLIDRILEEIKDPYRVFNELCFAFIGELPFAFTKSVDAMERFIASERRYRTHYSEEFNTCMERCIEKFGEKREDASSETIRACLPICMKEVGGTIEEYYMKLQEKAKKLPFPQRMFFAEGYTDEEIEKMLDDLKKQERYREKS